jgi:hypothetical protein
MEPEETILWFKAVLTAGRELLEERPLDSDNYDVHATFELNMFFINWARELKPLPIDDESHLLIRTFEVSLEWLLLDDGYNTKTITGESEINSKETP